MKKKVIVVRRAPVKTDCGHTKKEQRCGAHECCACYMSKMRKLWYPRGAEETAAAQKLFQLTGGLDMAKATVKGGKAVKVARVTAGSILLPFFEKSKCPDNDFLIKTVKAATGSKKFDETQLAWYKSQFRRGLLKGMNGKAGHVINQGGLVKKEVVKGRAVKKAKKASAEPIED